MYVTAPETSSDNFRKKRKARSSSEESSESNNQSSSEESIDLNNVSTEVHYIGTPAVFKPYEINGQIFVVKQPLNMQRRSPKKPVQLNVAEFLESSESDTELIFQAIKKDGAKVVARSKSNGTEFELLNTPTKDIRSLEIINEHTQREHAQRKLSRTLKTQDTCDSQKNSLLKNVVERQAAPLRIKLRRSSKQSNYEIDSDSDGSTYKKHRKRTVSNTSKRLSKVNSKVTNASNVQSDDEDDVKNDSSIEKLCKKLPRLEIKLKPIDLEVVRKSSRDRKVSTKYLDYYIDMNSPRTANNTPNKRVRRTTNYNKKSNNDDDDLTQNKNQINLRSRRSTVDYCEEPSSNQKNELKNETSMDTITSGNETEYCASESDDISEESSSDSIKPRIRYSQNHNMEDSNRTQTQKKRESNDSESDESSEEACFNIIRRTSKHSQNDNMNASNTIQIQKKMESNASESNESSEENFPNKIRESIRYSQQQKETPTKSGARLSKSKQNYSKPAKASKKSERASDVATPSRRAKRLDLEHDEPMTPKRSVLTPKIQTPSSAIRNGLLTPSMRQRNLRVSKPSTPLQKAGARLHVSAVPKSLPCREKEFNNIYTFLEGKLMDNSGGCLYISGVPGTGKTATVNEVINCLKKSVSQKKIDNFEFIEINGMKLTEPRQAYVEISKQLLGKKTTWEQAYQLLDKRFTKPVPRRLMTLLLVDELDILCNKRQDVVYNLFDWPAKSSSHLVVITIANTMDLPERVLKGRVTSRLGLTRLTFQPYTHKQLQEIITARLNDSHVFKNEAIQLVARKVAAVSGDARRALDICRRATEVAEVNNSEMVSMQDVNQALMEMIASAQVQAIKHCSEMEQMFLQAVCAEVARTGVEEVIFNNVYIQLTSLCALEGIKVPSVTEAITICARLGASRLLICEHSRVDIHQRILLNISPDDVHYSMQNIEV